MASSPPRTFKELWDSRSDSPTASSSVRDDLNAAYAQHQRTTVPTDPQIEEPPRTGFPTGEVVIFVAGELVAFPMAFVGYESLWNSAPASGEWWRGLFGFGAGLVIGTGSASFRWWGKRLGLATQNWIRREAWKWWVPISVTLAFAYVIGPDFYRRATERVVPFSPQDIAVAIAPIIKSEIEALKATGPIIPTTTGESNLTQPKSAGLGLDDAQFWRILRKFKEGSIEGEVCRTSVSYPTQDTAGYRKTVDVWSDINMVLYYSDWKLSQQNNRAFFPPGISIYVNSDSGPVFNCANRLAELLRSFNIDAPVHANTSTPALAACNNQCVDVALGQISGR
jgi:hypothetical protein